MEVPTPLGSPDKIVGIAMVDNELQEVNAVGPHIEQAANCLDCDATWSSDGAVKAARDHALDERHVVNVTTTQRTTLWPWEEALLGAGNQ